MLQRLLLACLILLSSGIPVCSQNAAYIVDGAQEKEQYRSHTILEAIESESNVVYTLNGVQLYMIGIRMNKTSGGTLDKERRKTGSNAAFRATTGSQVQMESCDVTSHVINADGVTVKDAGTVVNIVKGSFHTSRNASAALNVADGAKITVQDADILTSAGQSPAFFSGDGGYIEIVNSKGNTLEAASPVFMIHGKLKARECQISTDRWAIGQVDRGELILQDNELKSKAFCGIMVYGAGQERSNGVVDMSHNEMNVTEGPLFLVTNSNARITLTRNDLTGKDGTVLVAKADDWGVKGQNGGNAVLMVKNQKLNGDIEVDSISSVVLEMDKKAFLSGAINAKANPVAEVRIVMKKGSVWKLDKDSYLTSIVFSEPLSKGLKQIKGKHTVYYNPADPANAPLDGKKHKIGGGGSLCPIQN